MFTPQNQKALIDQVQPIRKFSKNENGRDFIVGDIHGNYSLLLSLLEHVKFDFVVDRLFSTGDLVDRGPEPNETLGLIDESWFHPVMGNHDFYIPQFAHDIITLYHWLHDASWAQDQAYGKSFIDESTPEVASWWGTNYARVMSMPMINTVEHDDGNFHVIHAELNFSKFDITDNNLANPEFVRTAWGSELFPGDGLDGIWRRVIFGTTTDGVVPQWMQSKVFESVEPTLLSTIYSGHTIQPKVAKCGPFVCIDTGGFLHGAKNHGLTIVEHATKQAWRINDAGIFEYSF